MALSLSTSLLHPSFHFACGFIEIEVSLSLLYIRVLRIGELCAARRWGVTWNGWEEYRQARMPHDTGCPS